MDCKTKTNYHSSKMRKGILYSSRHGFTKRCLMSLNEQCENRYELIDDVKTINLDEFDELLIGGALYHKRLSKDLIYFMEDNTQGLSNKKIGLFLIGLKIETLQKCFELNFPPLLLNQFPRAYLGGSTNTSKLNVIEKIELNKIIKKQGYEAKEKDIIRYDNIERLLKRFSDD